MRVAPLFFAAALALPLAVSAQTPAGSVPVTSQTPVTPNGATTTTTTTSTAPAADAPLSKGELKSQRKQQKREEKSAKANAKAAKDNAKALKAQDKATDAVEKTQPH